MTIVSHKHKFYFVRTQKTASTTLFELLKDFCGPDDFVTGTHQGIEQIRKEHDYPYKSFAFERNPWDKMVSWWWATGYYEPLDFDAWLFKQKPPSYYSDFSKYADVETGVLLVDFVGDVEFLELDLRWICAIIGIPWEECKLPKKNSWRKKDKPYQEYYTNRTRAMVEEAFAPEIEKFGYEFENGYK